MNRTESFNKLKSFLDYHIDQKNTGCVTVLPLRCGLGKSTYIRHRISDTLRNGTSGLIVITDALDRMDEYLNSDDLLGQFLRRNRSKIAMLTSKTLSEELKTQWKKPVLIMTTQRYFNLTRAEIMEYTRYSGGKRDKIIFDEKPYLIEQRQIDIGTFNDVDTALHSAIDDTVDPVEKAWIIEQWENLRDQIESVISNYERMNENQMETWHYNHNDAMTADDERFIDFVNRYRPKLNQFDNSTYGSILAIQQLIYEGATFTSKKLSSGEYRKYFTVAMDNSDKLLDLGADVFVLDGTADINPEYNLHYVTMIDCQEFLIPLTNLTINLVDIPTSKNQLCKPGSHSQAIIQCIKDYLLTAPEDTNIIFTYKGIEDLFKKDFTHIEHFGNIKGSNKFRNDTSIAQIGLNRYPDIAYKQIAYLTKLLEHDYGNHTVTRWLGKNAVENVMNLSLLADIEQNLFRSKLRNVDCTDSITYTIFLNTTAYSNLVDLIKDRYEKDLGATINVVPCPAGYQVLKSKARKADTKTKVQIVLEWLEQQPKGREFSPIDLRSECGLTKDQYKSVKKSKAVCELLIKMSTDTLGLYVVR